MTIFTKALLDEAAAVLKEAEGFGEGVRGRHIYFTKGSASASAAGRSVHSNKLVHENP